MKSVVGLGLGLVSTVTRDGDGVWGENFPSSSQGSRRGHQLPFESKYDSSCGEDILALEARENLLDDLDCCELATHFNLLGRDDQGAGRSQAFQPGKCPFCQSEKFHVDPDWYHCSNCNQGGHALTLFSALRGCSSRDTYAGLNHLLSTGQLVGRRTVQQRWCRLMLCAQTFFREVLINRQEGLPGRRWLVQQGVRRDTWEVFGLGYLPEKVSSISSELVERLREASAQDQDIEQIFKRWTAQGVFLPQIDDLGRHWEWLTVSNTQKASVRSESSFLRMREIAPNRFGRLIFPHPSWPRDLGRQASVLLTHDPWEVVLLLNAGIENAVYLGALDSPGYFESRIRTVCALAARIIIPLHLSAVNHPAFDGLLACLDGRLHQVDFFILPEGEQLADVLRKEGGEGVKTRLKGRISFPDFLSLGRI